MLTVILGVVELAVGRADWVVVGHRSRSVEGVQVEELPVRGELESLTDAHILSNGALVGSYADNRVRVRRAAQDRCARHLLESRDEVVGHLNDEVQGSSPKGIQLGLIIVEEHQLDSVEGRGASPVVLIGHEAGALVDGVFLEDEGARAVEAGVGVLTVAELVHRLAVARKNHGKARCDAVQKVRVWFRETEYRGEIIRGLHAPGCAAVLVLPHEAHDRGTLGDEPLEGEDHVLRPEGASVLEGDSGAQVEGVGPTVVAHFPPGCEARLQCSVRQYLNEVVVLQAIEHDLGIICTEGWINSCELSQSDAKHRLFCRPPLGLCVAGCKKANRQYHKCADEKAAKKKP